METLRLPAAPAEYTSLLPKEGTVEQLKIWGYSGVAQDEGLHQKLTAGIRGDLKQEDEPMVLACFASTKTSGSNSLQTYGFALPTVEGYFSGVGDLFSALVLGFYKTDLGSEDLARENMGTTNAANKDYKSNDLPPFAAAVSKALLGVQQILLRTHLHTLQVAKETKKRERRDSNNDIPEEADCIPSDPELDSLPPTPVSKGALPIPARIARRMRMRELRVIQEKGTLLKLAEEDQVGWPARLLDWSQPLLEKELAV